MLALRMALAERIVSPIWSEIRQQSISAAAIALELAPQFGSASLQSSRVSRSPDRPDLWNGDAQFLNNPSRLNFDMALFKTIPIHEAIALQFRVEAFNVFNHTEWASGNTTASTTGSGGVATPRFTCTAEPTIRRRTRLPGERLPATAGGARYRILQFGLKLFF